ncbi:MAG: Holliday junction branch migration protein RuvA [Candidatus Methanoperedens sp.]|nr:Holliday junction branch migration protein RuvA [Candidatus Methanoperedens sp.]
MISHIYGEIAYQGDGFVVIDVEGIGYHVNVTKTASQGLSDIKKKVKLHTHLHVREDALALYGFASRDELEMFMLLISVTRVGPQVAMNVLSQISIEELAGAIINEDERVLTRISGVGQKNARRLILELKDKIKKKMQGYNGTVKSPVNYDAVSALVSLGFPEKKAEEAVNYAASTVKDATVEALIKAALVKLKER